MFFIGLLYPPQLLAQSLSYLAIPSSGFSPRNSTTVKSPLRGRVETLGYRGNVSGTARFFGDNDVMFAPVNLPHGSTVVKLTCGGHAPKPNRRVSFVLRRNHPQQANVDMAALYPKVKLTGFQTMSDSSIRSPVIDNRRFNYYIAATIDATNDIQQCASCSVNRCTIAYGLPQSTRPAKRVLKKPYLAPVNKKPRPK